jgi:peptidoglycan/LPS O-acetylase OafA/YrhL
LKRSRTDRKNTGGIYWTITMQYRREIDGLRAVAVLPVILFHAGFEVFSGGYIGVDVFFVISGYLITSILIGELEQGTFSITRFYERRARRILPALFLVMLACLPFAYMWMLPSQLEDFGQSLIAVSLFLSNWLFWSETGYFGAAGELKPLLHTWSLAVEEQYYLLFPIFMLVLWRFGRNLVFWSVITIATFSLLLSEWGWRNEPEINFFFTFSRFWELLAGSICAFLTVGKAHRSGNLLSLTGLGLIVFSIFYYDENTPFPSLYALTPVGGTALIILFASQKTWVARLLSTAPFVSVGLISYSAYIWHQPLFAFARLRSLTEPSHVLMAGLAGTSIALAWATWYWVEQPFRKRPKPLLAAQRSLFFASGAVGAVFVGFGLAGHIEKGFGWRSNGSINFGNLEQKLVLNYGLHRDCEHSFNQSANCFTSATPNVLLWGDSFAMHLAQGIIASEPEISMQQQTLSSCSPILGLALLGGQNCVDFNDSVIAWLQRQHSSVDLVILSSTFGGPLGGRIMSKTSQVSEGAEFEYVTQKLRETVDVIRQTGARVVIVSPTPSSGWNTGLCSMRSVLHGEDEASCNFALDVRTGANALLRRVSDYVPTYWLYKDICDENTCYGTQDGIVIYRDGGHLSEGGSAYLGRTHNWMQEFRLIAN